MFSNNVLNLEYIRSYNRLNVVQTVLSKIRSIEILPGKYSFLGHLSFAHGDLFSSVFVRRRPSCVVRKLLYIELKLKNYWRDFNETSQECSVDSPDQVLLFFKSIWNPIWLPWRPSWKTYFKLKLNFHWRNFNEIL